MGSSISLDRIPFPNRDGTWTIPLTRGKSAIIDACDLSKVAGRLWFAHMRNKKPEWYATGIVDGKQIRLHRFLLGLQSGDPRQADHIDGDVANNRRSNLRICNNAQNNRNRKTAVGRVGFKGVVKRGRRFAARLNAENKAIFLGSFATPEEAAIAYDAAAIEHFGDFACTNADLGLLEASA